jgi:murein DD-endopeptidase MepM/ murein hydrolase activator NlpD
MAERAAAAARAAAARAAEDRAAVVRAAAERAAAYSAARSAVAGAQAALDAAKLDYASAKAEFDAALARVDLVHALAEDAASTADTSRRVLGALIRALTQQQSGTATADVLLDSQNGGNLLYQLGTLDKLAKLTGNMDAIRARVEADSARALALSEQEAAAQAAVQQVPVAQALTAMKAAEAALAAATARLALLSVSAPVGMAGLTPLNDIRAAIPAGRPNAQGWVTPAVGSINDVFGPRPTRPVPGVGAVHYGTDIGASCGAAIYAANAGVVVAAGSAGTYGNWILIDHGNGVETGYAHVAPGQTFVAVGDAVIAGEVIAGVGSTGASTGCHLHFEVRVNGTRVDAQPYLAERGVVLGR